MTASADELVAAWLVRRYRSDYLDDVERQDELIADGRTPRFPISAARRHLVGCDVATATGVEGGDGTYGCDTGCDYVRLEARISCPHGHSDDFEYGDFGEMADILDDLEKGRDPS